MHENFYAFVCLPWNKGQKKVGTQQGAAWIAQYLETAFSQNTQQFLVDQDVDITYNLQNMYKEILKHPAPYIFAGGDHSEAISTVLATVNNPKYVDKKVGLIWIDAHADINTYDVSKSKNFHGMPLSFICGIDKSIQWVNELKKLPLTNLLYYGVRDLDQYQENLITKQNIKVVKVEDDFEEIFKWMEEINLDVVFISFDVDALDPVDIPSTGTTAPNGLRTQTMCKFFKRLREVCEKLNVEWNIEIVEYNPLIGKEQEKRITEANMQIMLDALFK